ncbi:hypothetical protein [Falsiroseomonas sp. CW058]|uniref:hypothetical protein n=1 Tax=Falsiroseomonas sp. CW058 TaxID=3388664 RepID=UPI003D31763F
MRRLLSLALPAVLLAAPASAQHWNDSGPGRDLLSSTITEFDSFRQRAPQQPGFAAPGAAPQQQARAPIPILDWVPPPPAAAAPAPRRSAPRRVSRPRAPDPVMRDPAPLPAAAPVSSGGGDWERSLSERERELDRLRRILEEDRLRYQQARQPQLR